MSHFYLDIHEARIREAYYRLMREIVIERAPLEAVVAVTPEPVSYAKRESLKYRPIRQGQGWGETWDCGWFHITGAVPKAWKGAYVTVNLELGGEILVFDAKGCPLLGMTCGCVFDGEYSKDHWHYLKSAKGGDKIDFWCDVGCNGLFGVPHPQDPADEPNETRKHGYLSAAVNQLSVCRFDYDKWQLKLDLDVLLSQIHVLPENSSRRTRVVRQVSQALDLLPPECGGAAAVRDALRKTVFALGPDPASLHVTAIGHAHIDTGWKWPYRETIRKVARTWSSQIGLISRYPGYKFGASQAQLYLFCKENYPALYAKIKEAVAKKQWEIHGGMWVEADTNVPSGESLIRQFLEGDRFFKEEFGIVPRNLWLPDVFGYSGNMPQIMTACGIDFLLTQKLSWNRYNKFPHNSFVWQGVDGSQVVTHFPPEDTYNSNLLPDILARHETTREAGIVDEAISLFGIGDGGGGPKEEHVEWGLRTHALNGCPRVEFAFAQDALDRIAAKKDELDTWVGELYFEMHRGTYTTQARQKLLNRRSEEALRAAEMLCAAAMAQAGFAYPADAFRKMWRDVLLCQFHDVIPGSSIARVYKESGELLARVIADAHALAAKAARKMLRKDADSFTLFNPSTTAFSGAVPLPEGWKGLSLDGKALPAQAEANGVVAKVEVPPCAFATFKRADDAKAAKTDAAKKGIVLENDLVRYELDAQLKVVKAFDKTAGRTFILPEAPANMLRLFDDHPSTYDAWDIEEYLYNMPVAEPEIKSVKVVRGPVRDVVYAAFKMGGSDFEQEIRLEAGSKRLDFVTDVEWRETHRICRVAFPVDIHADEASAEIQYGVLRRATNDNTKWQYAQFESCAHRYADLSDAEFGVALLNDSKYGYRMKGHELSLSLLRAPTEPDPFADKGHHRFTYAVLPHVGALSANDEVVASASMLNQGVERFEGCAVTAKAALPVVVEGDGIELAVLKKAEDSGALVVRLVERRGRRAIGKLLAKGGAAKLVPCLATELADVGKAIDAGSELVFRPYEIKTFRVEKA